MALYTIEGRGDIMDSHLIDHIQSGNGVIDYVDKGLRALYGASPRLPGEISFPLHTYTGPHTNLLEREKRGGIYTQPFDAVDACSKTHDYDYLRIGNDMKTGKINRKDAIKQVKLSDQEYVNCANNAKVSGISRIAQFVAPKIIQAKMKTDDYGLTDPLKYVGSGSSLYRFGRRQIRKKKQKGQKGQGIPALLLGTLASFLIPELIKKLTS